MELHHRTASDPRLNMKQLFRGITLHHALGLSGLVLFLPAWPMGVRRRRFFQKRCSRLGLDRHSDLLALRRADDLPWGHGRVYRQDIP